MYYNTRTSQLIESVPLNGYFEDGTLVQGLNLADTETQKLCGIVSVKSDSPAQPENTVEDTSQRQIVIEDDGVLVIRVWIPTPLVVPSRISPRQIRLWLVTNNISLATVDSTIESITDEILKEKTKIEWEFSPYIERDHPMINTIGVALGLTNEQIDMAFIDASQL